MCVRVCGRICSHPDPQLMKPGTPFSVFLHPPPPPSPSRFAISLNDPGDRIVPWLPPTDTRFRPDQVWQERAWAQGWRGAGARVSAHRMQALVQTYHCVRSVCMLCTHPRTCIDIDSRTDTRLFAPTHPHTPSPFCACPQRALETGEWTRSTSEKLRLEEKQRQVCVWGGGPLQKHGRKQGTVHVVSCTAWWQGLL